MPATKIQTNEWRLPTDENHLIKVDSHLIMADWSHKKVYAGQKAPFIIRTAFVGHGANALIKGMSEQGRNLGVIDEKVLNDRILGSFDIPSDIASGDQIYFTVTFDFNVIYPPNNPGGFSSTIPVYPMPQLPTLMWSKSRINSDETITLKAGFTDVPDNTPVVLNIYHIIEEGTYDRITQIKGAVQNGSVTKQWRCGDALAKDQIVATYDSASSTVSYDNPHYIFTVTIGNKEYGKAEEASDRLEVFFKPRYRFSI